MVFYGKRSIPKPFKWIVVGVTIGELAGLAGCFYLYRKMNSSQDLRRKVYDYDKRILNAYYEMNLKYGSGDLRKQDAIAWGISDAERSSS